MDKTHKQIVYSILESVYDHAIPDDHSISEEFVAGKVNDVNVRLVEEMQAKGKPMDSFYQKICCIEVKCEKQGCTINGKFIASGDVLWSAKLPKLNSKIGWSNISYLGISDLDLAFRRVSTSSFTSAGILEFGKKAQFMVAGDVVYFKNLPTSGTKMLCILAILSNPTTACNWNDDTPYPTPDAYKLELLVKQDILSTFPALPKDEQQDSRDNVSSAQGKQGTTPQQNE